MDESKKYRKWYGNRTYYWSSSREGPESVWVLVEGETIVLVEDGMLLTHLLEEKIIQNLGWELRYLHLSYGMRWEIPDLGSNRT